MAAFLTYKLTDDPGALLLTIVDGKTGFRLSNTMPAAVTVYERIKKRNPDMSGPENYLFSAISEPKQRKTHCTATVQRSA